MKQSLEDIKKEDLSMAIDKQANYNRQRFIRIHRVGKTEFIG